MRYAPNLKRQPDGPDFYNHGEDLAAGILYMADAPENLKHKTELLPEMTASILETAYREDGCTDEIKTSAFKKSARDYLKADGWKALEALFNAIIEQERPVSAGTYLLELYEKLRAEFEKQFESKSFDGGKVADTAASTGERAKKVTGGLN